MASIAIMAGGAVLNAAAFIGGNYLARALHLAEVTKLHLTKKYDMIKLSRRIKRLTPNTPVTGPNFSTGLRLTRK